MQARAAALQQPVAHVRPPTPAPCCMSSTRAPRPAGARRRTTAAARTCPSPARAQSSCTAGLRRIPARRAPARGARFRVRFRRRRCPRERPALCRDGCTCSRSVLPHLDKPRACTLLSTPHVTPHVRHCTKSERSLKSTPLSIYPDVKYGGTARRSLGLAHNNNQSTVQRRHD